MENYICEMASLLNSFTSEISATGLKVFQEHANDMLFYLKRIKQISLFLGNVNHGTVLLENCRDFYVNPFASEYYNDKQSVKKKN